MSLLKISLPCIRCGILALLIFAAIGFIQDEYVFPGAVDNILSPQHVDPQSIDPNLRSSFVTTSDDHKIEVWYLPASGPDLGHSPLLILHGDGGTVADSYELQKWFSANGYPTYSFDYRGFGRSSGWPTERGIYDDSETVIQHISNWSAVDPADISIVGVSFGTAPAAYLADKFHSKQLVLVAPYTNISDSLQSEPYLKYLRPLFWYRFPTAEFVSQLTSTCFIVAHGKLDQDIPLSSGQAVYAAYRGTSPNSLLVNDEADHNDIFWEVREELLDKMKECRKL